MECGLAVLSFHHRLAEFCNASLKICGSILFICSNCLEIYRIHKNVSVNITFLTNKTPFGSEEEQRKSIGFGYYNIVWFIGKVPRKST